jgi:hypothetical protein
MTIAVMGTYGSGSEVVDERIVEGIFVDGGVLQVFITNSPSMEVQVGGVKGCDFDMLGEVISVGESWGEHTPGEH